MRRRKLDWEPPHAHNYDLITLRLVYPFLSNRDQTVHALGRRLRPGGALVVITPLAADTPAERRGIALGEDELAELQHPGRTPSATTLRDLPSWSCAARAGP